MNKPSISILVDVPLMRILGVLTTCLDTSACMGWVHSYEAKLPPDFNPRALEWLDDREFWCAAMSPAYFAPLVEGGELVLKLQAGMVAEGESRLRSVDRISVERGLAVMAKVAPYQFSKLLNSEDDATTADVLLQCCVFGELIY